MGTNLHFYAGPALVCNPRGQQVQRQKEGVCLECHPLHRHIISREKSKGKNKFCVECGKPLQDIVVLEKGTVDRYFVTEEIKEAMTFLCNCDDCDDNILTPNVSRKAPREFSLDGWNGTVHEELQQEAIAQEISWFQQAFTKEIARVREIYGANNVKVAWLLFSYWL